LINLTFPRENSQLFQCAFHVTGILLRFVADMDCSAKSRSAPDSSAVLVHLSKIIWQAFIRRLLVDASLTNSVWYENPRASAWGPVRRQCWLCVSCSFNTDSTKSLSRGILSSLLKGYPVPVSFVFPNTHLFFRKEYFYGRTPPWAYPSMGVPLHYAPFQPGRYPRLPFGYSIVKDRLLNSGYLVIILKMERTSSLFPPTPWEVFTQDASWRFPLRGPFYPVRSKPSLRFSLLLTLVSFVWKRYICFRASSPHI